MNILILIHHVYQVFGEAFHIKNMQTDKYIDLYLNGDMISPININILHIEGSETPNKVALVTDSYRVLMVDKENNVFMGNLIDKKDVMKATRAVDKDAHIKTSRDTLGSLNNKTESKIENKNVHFIQEIIGNSGVRRFHYDTYCLVMGEHKIGLGECDLPNSKWIVIDKITDTYSINNRSNQNIKLQQSSTSDE